jgi:hypothetical protein
VVKFCLPTTIEMGERTGTYCSWVYFFFVGGPSSSAMSNEAISSMGCLASQPFYRWRELDCIYICWAVVTDDQRYPGYKTPTGYDLPRYIKYPFIAWL